MRLERSVGKQKQKRAELLNTRIKADDEEIEKEVFDWASKIRNSKKCILEASF